MPLLGWLELSLLLSVILFRWFIISKFFLKSSLLSLFFLIHFCLPVPLVSTTVSQCTVLSTVGLSLDINSKWPVTYSGLPYRSKHCRRKPQKSPVGCHIASAPASEGPSLLTINLPSTDLWFTLMTSGDYFNILCFLETSDSSLPDHLSETGYSRFLRENKLGGLFLPNLFYTLSPGFSVFSVKVVPPQKSSLILSCFKLQRNVYQSSLLFMVHT